MDHQSSHANLASLLCLSLGEDNTHIHTDDSFHISHDSSKVVGSNDTKVPENLNDGDSQGTSDAGYIVVYESFGSSGQPSHQIVSKQQQQQLQLQQNSALPYSGPQNEGNLVVFGGYISQPGLTLQQPNHAAIEAPKTHHLHYLPHVNAENSAIKDTGLVKTAPCNNPNVTVDVPSIDTVIQRVVQGDLPENCIPLVQVEPEMFTEEPHMVVKAGPKANHPKGSGQFVCQFCNKKFTENRTLQRHIMIHKNYRPHRCETCNKGFILVGDLRRHMRIHNGERPYACKICGKSFILKGNLIQHFRTHAPDKQFTCVICRKTYAHKESLHRHIRGHFGDKPYECTSCGKRFLLKGDLNRHVLVHSEKKPYSCETCGRQFAMKGNLRQHMKSRCRTGRLTHKIPIIVTVKKAEPRSPVLDEHVRTSMQNNRTGMQDLRDNIQDLRTSVQDLRPSTEEPSNSVQNPQAILQNPRTSVPDLQPDQSNAQNLELQKSSSEKLNEEMLPMDLCETVTDVCSPREPVPSEQQRNSPAKDLNPVDLTSCAPQATDQKAQERESAACSLCHKSFPDHLTLQKHFHSDHEQQSALAKVKGKNICTFCGKEFALKGDLKRHLDYHNGIKPFRCEYCPKTFTLKSNLVQHYTTHRQDKPFNCPMCNKAFSNQRNMKLHLRRHELARANFGCTKCGLTFLSKSDHFFHECGSKTKSMPASMSESGVALTVEVLTSGFTPTNENDHEVIVPTVEELSNANITVMSTNSASRLKKEVERLSCTTESPQTFAQNEGAAAVNGIQSILSRICQS